MAAIPFALVPALVNNGVIDDSTTEGAKLYQAAIEPLTDNQRKLFESSKAKILILDERVQSFYENDKYMDIPYYDLYKYANITVPFSKNDGNIVASTIEPEENFLNLGQDRFDTTFIKKFQNYVGFIDNRATKTTSSNDSKTAEKNAQKTSAIKVDDYDIIVLHYSLLERMEIKDTIGQKDKNRDEYKYRKDFLDQLAKKCKRLVLTSGRGNPREELQNYNVSFVGLAALINALHTTRSKYLLYNILTNSRK